MAVTGIGTTKTATRKPTQAAVLMSSQSPMGVLLALLLVAMAVVAAVAIMAAALIDSSLNVFVKLFTPIPYHRS